jgi:3-oxosteroid 1-dehydrogenase
MATWDGAYDFIVIGSGGGLAGALAARKRGARVLVLEKRDVIGGSTAMSGGVIWIPNNPLMRADGIADSYEDAWAYFEDVVGDVGPASSDERRHAFLTCGPEMVSSLQDDGVRFIRCRGFSDYYSSRKGGHDDGRSIEAAPFDAQELGGWYERLQPGMASGIGLVVKTNELKRDLMCYNRSLRTFGVATRVFARTYGARVRGETILTNGASLVGQMLKVAVSREIDVWTRAPLEGFVVEDGRVVGVRVQKDGVPYAIAAGHGVLIAAGGFARNAEMRRSYSGAQPNEAQWTRANAGDTGEAIRAAMDLGARTDLMDEAWWHPEPAHPLLAGSTISSARQRPGTILVDASGRRFANEANSYVEVGKAMYARDKESRAVPCWLIMDDLYRRRYAHTKSLPGRFPPEWIEQGAIVEADTLKSLAEKCRIDASGLEATVAEFNRNARNGVDPQFGRGESAHNRGLGDPRHTPNPALGPIERPPFYATEIVPADVGTCGGLLTDEHARVLREDGAPIPGLYATGNSTATVLGRHYLGAGASIASSMVFAHVAALHATHGAGG